MKNTGNCQILEETYQNASSSDNIKSKSIYYFHRKDLNSYWLIGNYTTYGGILIRKVLIMKCFNDFFREYTEKSLV